MRLLAPDPELGGWHLSAGRLNWLCVSLALVIAPHVARMPLWVPGLFALMALWRLWRVNRGDDRPPGRWLLVAIALALVPAVYATFDTITGRLAGVAMLILLSGVKLLETRGIRDCYVLNYLGFFLVITNFLFDQGIGTGLYMLLVVLVMTATLHALGVSPGHDPRMGIAVHLRRAAVLMAQAVPLMLVLFVLFPRVPGPLWGLPKDAHTGRVGLSNRMSPGDIGSLTLSDEVAFRVRFDGRVPPLNRLYWRGPVLSQTDGRTWSWGLPIMVGRAVRYAALGSPVDYEVTLEPHGRRWYFALDLPATLPRGAVMSGDLQIRSRRDVNERVRYRMRSYLDYELEPRVPHEQVRLLALPRGRHPQARALARQWRSEVTSDQAMVERVLTWFREEAFRYTLTPALLPGDPVDDFLFGTREGFCEHYAGAFVVLMRAAGIPARVVTGYQGGEMNPVGDYVLVRQRDAHAWSEVWLRGRGWVRVDPTSAVSPERIDRGIDAAIPPTLGPRGLEFQPAPAIADTFRRLRQVVDAVQARWNAWVLGYGPERQREALSRLGVDVSGTGSLVVLLTLAVAVLMTLLAGWMFLNRRGRDPARACYDRFCAKLARRGLPRLPQEGPRDYARRVTSERPDLAAAVAAITDGYVALRYAGAGHDLTELRRRVAAFRP